MPLVAFGAGQAGNQILGLTARYVGPLTGQGKKQPGYAFIDSEPKVVRPLRTPGDPCYLPFASAECIVYDQNGRGNNWAWGYTGAASHRQRAGDGPYLSNERGDTLAARSVASIRRQAEATDRFDSLMLVHSLGGGTGSGLSSRLMELTRDAYPDATIISACVAPFETGDTPLQWYNTVLTLATAHEVADVIAFFDNTDLLQRTGKLRAQAASLFTHDDGLGGSRPGSASSSSSTGAGANNSSGSKISTQDVNNTVAQCLAGLMLPTKHRKGIPRVTRTTVAADNDVESESAFGRPGWVNVAEGIAKPQDAFHNPYAEPEGEEADGTGAEDDDGFDADGPFSTSHPSFGRPLTSVPWDALGFAQHMVPSPAFKYVDIRSAAPLQPARMPLGSSSISGGDPSSVNWVDLSEMIVDTLPRHDRSGRPVITLTSLLTARGASQADCDAIDPSLNRKGDRAGMANGSGPGRPGASSSSAAGGRGGRPSTYSRGHALAGASEASAWRGLPQGPDWNQVALRLKRAQTFATSAVPPERARLARLSPCPVYESPIAPLRQPRTLTLASNSSWHVPVLTKAVQRVGLQMRVRAYLHWYERFGIDAEHITVAAESVAEAADAYASLLPMSRSATATATSSSSAYYRDSTRSSLQPSASRGGHSSGYGAGPRR